MACHYIGDIKCHSFSIDVDDTIHTLTEEQRHNAIGRLQDCCYLIYGACRATINKPWCVKTTQEALTREKPRQG